MSFNVTASAVKGWQVTWTGAEIRQGERLLLATDDPWSDLAFTGLDFTSPGEFSAAEDDHLIGVLVATVGDYCDRVAAISTTEKQEELLAEFQKKHGLSDPQLFIAADCS